MLDDEQTIKLLKPLTKRQEDFVRAYVGEAKGIAYVAAKIAGYKGNRNSLDVTASRLLKNPKIVKILAKIGEEETKILAKKLEQSAEAQRIAIVDRQERREILSEFARDADATKMERMKAIELLGKMGGDFIERRQIEGNIKYENTRKEIREKLDRPEMWENVCNLGDELIESEA